MGNLFFSFYFFNHINTKMSSAARSLAGKTLFITGGSRGIGLAIGVRAARDGANVVLAAKTASEHKTLPGTIYSAAKEVEEAGGKALPLQLDIRDENAIQEALKKAADEFGGIDILVNNASAINNRSIDKLPMKRFDLMHQINCRGTYATTKFAMPYLLKAENPHVLMLSPPLSLHPKWMEMAGTGYTMAKFGMSMTVVGMAEEYKEQGVAFNGLWPKTAIATAAIKLIAGNIGRKASRNVDIMSDAAHIMLTNPSREFTGNVIIDEEILMEHGADPKSMNKYNMSRIIPPAPDFFHGNPENFGMYTKIMELAQKYGL